MLRRVIAISVEQGIRLSHPRHFLAFGFGAGLAKWAPGTWGTLVAVPIYAALVHLPVAGYLAVVAAMLVAGVWICGATADELGVHDHSGIVWDEIVGYLVTMILAPEGWVWWLVGVVLFRVFDIAKPWPIRLIDERVGGGWGIMLDDVLAGLLACLSLQVLALAV